MNHISPNEFYYLGDDAAMIQAAADRAHETGAMVVIPRRNTRTGKDIWLIERAVRLRTGASVCLENCHLRQADGSFDNIFKSWHARTDEGRRLAARQYDIHIWGVGNAVLDGGMPNGTTERNLKDGTAPEAACFSHPNTMVVNSLIHLANTERVVIENLRMIHPRYWAVTFHYSAQVRVSDIHFVSCGNVPNQDGIDLRAGCSGFIIENISGYTQDDTVALTNLQHPGNFDNYCKVEGMEDDIHNVVINNVTSNTVCAQVRLLNQFGNKIYNVIIENVQNYAETDPSLPGAAGYAYRIPNGREYYMDSETTWAVPEKYWSTFEKNDFRAGASVRIGENGYYDPEKPETAAKPGDTYNITVRNVQSRCRFAVALACTLYDSFIDNVQCFGDCITAVYFGGGTYDNIRVSNIGYTHSAAHRRSDEHAAGGHYGYDQPAAVWFNGSKATGLRFSGITTAKDTGAVFGGGGEVELKARDIIIRNPAVTALLGGDTINADIREF
ncbi:MAG: glycosyl hydrolase family 28 protein [Eubacteriales bacterium]|jgi:hypothetical protein|nr:glycosyl hydrolase family 28 protein [Eubacteriales bacterium]